MVLEDTATIPSLRASCLEEIVGFHVSALFRRFHLNRDWIIGFVGPRGSGKSLSGANVAVRDFAMNDEPVWSNMQLKMGIVVDDELARDYGLESGGTAIYQAEHIDKQEFLRLDGRYEGGCLFFDEFNLEYGEARRSSANVNLMTDRAIQQLRKLQCGLIYTVLSETYLDVRIRENTDVFIKCSDVALKPQNLQQNMEQGVVFEWLVYPLSDKVAGVGKTFNETHKPLGPYRIQLKDLWETIDTLERQAVGKTTYSEKIIKAVLPVDMKDDPKVAEERDRWGWMDDKLLQFFERHVDAGEIIELTSREFAEELNVDMGDWGEVAKQLYKRLPNLVSVEGKGHSRPTRYLVPNSTLTGGGGGG